MRDHIPLPTETPLTLTVLANRWHEIDSELPPELSSAYGK